MADRGEGGSFHSGAKWDWGHRSSGERKRAKEDLDSPQETAHILRGGSTPTAAQKLYSIHTDTLVFWCQWEYVWLPERAVPEEQEERQRRERDISDKWDINVVKTCSEREDTSTNTYRRFYIITRFISLQSFSVSMPTQQHFETGEPLSSCLCTLLHLCSQTLNWSQWITVHLLLCQTVFSYSFNSCARSWFKWPKM